MDTPASLSETTVIELEQSVFNFEEIRFADSAINNPMASFKPVFNEVLYELYGYDMITGVPKDEFFVGFTAYGVNHVIGADVSLNKLKISVINIDIDYMNSRRIRFKPNYSYIYNLTAKGVAIEAGDPVSIIYGI